MFVRYTIIIDISGPTVIQRSSINPTSTSKHGKQVTEAKGGSGGKGTIYGKIRSNNTQVKEKILRCVFTLIRDK